MVGKNGKTQNKTTKSSDSGRAPFLGYVNVVLTEEDRSEYESWVSDAEVVAEAMLDAFDQGYQLTTKFDVENDCYSSSISNWHISAKDSGVIYTGRSSEFNASMLKAIFVWDRKLARDLNNGAVKNARRDAF